MILDLPIPPSWLRLVTTNAADTSASGDAKSQNGVDAPSAAAAEPSAQSDPEEESAQYFSQQSPDGEPCLLMVSPLLGEVTWTVGGVVSPGFIDVHVHSEVALLGGTLWLAHQTKQH